MTNLKWPENWPETSWTSDEWHLAMLQRLDKWLHWDNAAKRPPVHKWMGMDAEGFIEWRETHVVPRNTRVLWTIWPEELLA